MTRNLRLVLGVALLFGISTGVYEFILPLYLRAQGISLEMLGSIFAVAGVAMVLARIYMGGLADRLGRRVLYGWALAGSGLAAAFAPLFPGFLSQLVLKTLRETAALTRETLHPIVLYEEGHAGFLDRIGKFRGMEFLLQAFGTFLAMMLIQRLGDSPATYAVTLYIGGGVVLLGALIWFLGYRDQWQPSTARIISLRELVNFDLHHNLRVLLISGLIFTFGLQLSHSFYMVLFFKEQFHVSGELVGIAMLLHRVTIALPLLVVGNLPLKNLRAWYIAGLAIQGVTTAISPLMPTFWISAGIFLLHDLVGAGIWSPINATLVQRYSRDATRGLEVGKVLAWGSLGSIVGPLAAGFLAKVDPRLPFFLSGIFMGVAAIPLFWLNLTLPAPAERTTAEKAVA